MTAYPVRPVGIVVGLSAEARLVAAATPRRARGRSDVHCVFSDAVQSAVLIDAGVPALISFGIAGGLDAGLTPGTLVLAPTVFLPSGDVVSTDPEWRERVRTKLSPEIVPVIAPIVGSHDLVADPAAKAGLWTRTGAAAVDMESHAAAQAARRAGLPLLVLRAIADPATGRLPAAVRHGFSGNGRARPLAVLGGALLAPSQIPDLVRLARDSYLAMASLRRAVQLLGPRFGFDQALAA